ncbi:MAG: anti-phage dCTP deaminase [Acidobacteriaceae bacterium]
MMDNIDELGPEIFLALVGPVGVDLDTIAGYLSDALRRVRYRPDPLIHLAHIMSDIDDKYEHLPKSPFDVYVDSHMSAGNDIRQKTGRNDAMALLGISVIQKERRSNPEQKTIQRRAFIIRSLKHPEEVHTLRHIYGSSFYLLAVHGSHHERKLYLAKRISDSHSSMDSSEEFYDVAERLIKRDHEELGIPHGQNLRDTFHRADVFFDIGQQEETLRAEVRRFVELIFGNVFTTPTRAEYAMFHAAAAALRSAEPGRQVGAAIATNEGDIVSVGTNEVPKASGGLYWCDDAIDRRQFKEGYDSNQSNKRNLIAETLEYLKKAHWLRQDLQDMERDELLKQALDGDSPALPRRSQIRGLIEFGRAVHAEMAALIDAARRGVSVLGGTMYVTTFPCHLCARHIVAAGIKRVHYIEPYPKSLAVTLYPDSIALERADSNQSQILFEPFFGISPRRYFDLFTAESRRGPDDKLKLFDPSHALPRFSAAERVYLDNEDEMRAKLNERLGTQATLWPRKEN